MDYIKNTIKLNSTFYLILLTLLLTAGAISIWLFLLVAAVIAGCLVIPKKVVKNDDFNFFDYIAEKNRNRETNNAKRAAEAKLEAEKQAKIAEAERIEFEKEQRTKALIREQEIKAQKEKIHEEATKKALILEAQMKKDHADQEKIPSLDEIVESIEKEELSKLNSTTKQSETSQTESSTVAFEDDFSAVKHGTWINILLLIFGMFPVIMIALKINNITGSSTLGGGYLVIGLIGLVGSAVYYLPTFIYHASTGGKILMWIFNTVLSWTLIGWILLLVIATSRNKKSVLEQQNLHYLKKISDQMK